MIVKKQYALRTLIASSLLFFLMEGSATTVVWRLYESKKQFVLQRDVRIIKDVFVSTRHGYSKTTKLLVGEIIGTPEILAIVKAGGAADPALRAAARKRLYDTLLPTYQSLQQVNLKHLHFHLADLTSFLRFHRPEAFGDSLYGVRESLERANRDKVYVEGFETGRICSGFRHVYPLLDKNGEHLGSVETMLSPCALCGDIEKTTGFALECLVRRELVERTVWPSERGKYRPSLLSPAYLYESGTDEALRHNGRFRELKSALASEASERMQKNSAFALYRRGVIASFIPVANVGNEKGAGYLVGFHETGEIARIRRDMLTAWGLSSLAVTLIVILGALLLQKMLEIKKLAMRDGLTGLLNRLAVSERIRIEIARSRRAGAPLSLLYLDVDDFKKINDRYGHESGDAVLRRLADLLRRHTREADAVGRWGGEEFLICLCDTDGENARNVAEKLRGIIAASAFVHGIAVTCSFGVAVYRREEGIDDMVARADARLYEAKAAGKNRVCVDG